MKHSTIIALIALSVASCSNPTPSTKVAAPETAAPSPAPNASPTLVHSNNDYDTITPLTYVDQKNRITYRVESDGRHVSATAADGKLLWRRNPFVDARMKPYRVTKPVIRAIGTGRELGFLVDVDAIWIKFNSSQVGTLDPTTGDFHFILQD